MSVKKISETLFEFGGGASRVERTAVHAISEKGKASPPEWVVYRRVDVEEDQDTTYSYRYDVEARFPEEDEGEMPDAARDMASKLGEA